MFSDSYYLSCCVDLLSRLQYINWCLPLFDSAVSDNCTCSFLVTNGNINCPLSTTLLKNGKIISAAPLKRYIHSQLCTKMFPVLWLIVFHGLGAVRPDWVKNAQ